MNLLAKSDVFAENKLFATLDTTVRKVVIENVPFLLSDTVGFIRKLPHQLVEAFKSTLDEVREADILMHVVDISHPNFEEHIKVVEETLKDIKAIDKPIFVVINKIDAYRYEEYDEFSLEPKRQENYTLDEFKNSWIAKENTPCIFISAREKIGIEKLRGDLYKMVAERGELPKTAAITLGEIYNVFEKYINLGYDIIYTGISSHMSKSYENAVMTASEFPEGRIEVVASQNLSSGIGLVILKAIEWQEEGKDVHEVAKLMRETIPYVRS